MHAALEAWERSRRGLSTWEAQQVFAATWQDLIAKAKEKQPQLSLWLRGGRKSTENDISDRYMAGRQQVADYIDYMVRSPLTPMDLPHGGPAVEVGFITNIGGVLVKGFVDVLLQDREGVPLIRDIKTGSKKPYLPVQLKVYQRGIANTLGVRPEWADYYMAKDGKPADPVNVERFPDDKLEAWFSDMDRAEKAGIYLPNPSAETCWTCSVKRDCWAYQQT